MTQHGVISLFQTCVEMSPTIANICVVRHQIVRNVRSGSAFISISLSSILIKYLFTKYPSLLLTILGRKLPPHAY